MRLVSVVVALAAAALGADAAHAAQHPKPICDDFKAEQTLHEKNGVAADMAKGAAWGRINLPQQRLKEIERLIHVQEQLAFKCPQPKKPVAPGEDEDGSNAALPAKAPAKAKAAPKPAAKAAAVQEEGATAPKKPVKKAAPAETQANPATPAAPATSAATQPAKKPRPKTDDAFSPTAAGQTPSGPFRTP